MHTYIYRKKTQNWFDLQYVSFQDNTLSQYSQSVDKLLMSRYENNFQDSLSILVLHNVGVQNGIAVSALTNKQSGYTQLFFTAWLQARCLENENHGVLKKIVEGSLRLGRLEEKVKVSSVSELNSYCEMFGVFQ